jgi:phosphatidylinositol alpha-1,6-mannosyltransferase
MPNREIFHNTDSIEGFGISFIEASACGKPVIGGRSGGAVEAIEEGVSGLLVNPDSVEEFVSLVNQLLSNAELRTRMGVQGRQRMVREMDWLSRAQLLLEIEK